jgi:hypothetical protein
LHPRQPLVDALPHDATDAKDINAAMTPQGTLVVDSQARTLLEHFPDLPSLLRSFAGRVSRPTEASAKVGK